MTEERYFEIDGRRWRRTDPAIPEKLRAELVSELMSARRAVGAALKSGDAAAEKAARARVHDAKTALGERGSPWWEQPDDTAVAQRSRATARTLLRRRSPATICPSDVARVVGGEQWRRLMDPVRSALFEDARNGFLVVRQKGEDVDDLEAVRGPVRLAAGPSFDDYLMADSGR